MQYGLINEDDICPGHGFKPGQNMSGCLCEVYKILNCPVLSDAPRSFHYNGYIANVAGGSTPQRSDACDPSSVVQEELNLNDHR